MAGNFRVHAFGIVGLNDKTDDLEDVLNDILADDIEDRVRTIGQHEIRVEHIEKVDGLWHLDFVKFRDVHGPGKGSRKTKVLGFDFKAGEVFCEETALMYCPKRSYILLQYNHHGVRYSAIEDYFSVYSGNPDNQYELQAKYDDDVDHKFTSRKATKSLTLAIDPRLLSDKDRDSKTALGSAIELGDKSNASKIEITITAGREKKRFLSKFIDDTATKMKKLAEKNPDAVGKLRAGVVSSGVDEKLQVLDLIEERLCRNFTDIPVGIDKRWPRDARYKALERARRGWKKILG
ncbi:DUF6731 family protein [Aeromonas dhakensis]|uniref:DUF6731 family protein n=1 Tax=Aeromonas dhakensis TaxID=196024 RepID=UPI00398606A2